LTQNRLEVATTFAKAPRFSLSGASYFENRSQPIPVLTRNLRLGGLAFGHCVQKETGSGGKILGGEGSPRLVEGSMLFYFNHERR